MSKINRRTFLERAGKITASLACSTIVPSLFSSREAASAQRKPNIVFIFCDDLGWADLPCYGYKALKAHGGWTMRGDLRMPNIDRMASEGTMFTQFYVNSGVCSPSRTGVMTGRFPSQLGIHDYLARHDLNLERGMPDYVDPAVHTVPGVLREAGYATGHFGKWHLSGGGIKDAPSPEEYGIDRYAGCLDGPGKRPGSTEMIADETISFIDAHHNEPFYINVWLYDPHSPLNPTEEHLEPYSHMSSGWDGHVNAHQVWYGVLTNIDKQVGRIFAKLDELGLKDDTIVIFSSDNGPESGLMTFTSFYASVSSTSTGPFRGIKRSLYEGGIREPFIVRWPGKTPAGKVDDTTVLSGADLLLSLCSLSGAELPAEYSSDGEDMSRTFFGTPLKRTKPLMWENRFPVYGHVMHKSPMLAIREGRWKLLMNPDGDRIELYDIPADPTELNNRAHHLPELVDRLSGTLLRWREGLPPGPVHPDAGSNDYPFPE